MLNLESVGMERGLLYETVVTTRNEDGTPNAAPMGVICKNENEVVLYLHQGSQTVMNVKREEKFLVNITKDPMVFVESTLGNPSQESFEHFDNGYYIKGTDAFLVVEVLRMRDVEREDQFGVSTTTVINAKVQEIVKKKDHVEPLNRAIYGVIEALVYLTRMEMVSGDMEKLYRHRMREISRIVNKVGGLEHKRAMKRISDAFSKYE
ncbi:DUF447 domain-containing protein [Methanobacterium aggregans]|uniref:DUF447 domain-containing protein n=1 Tax=Methanobacterium aggregans TaxID=1615586 RepID=UPI001AE842C6|nr:DUF447 domain-containing protein [Methanobacterium aggregans]MBP2045674.1 hypothetical protein [Methanobacterium aggregans]